MRRLADKLLLAINKSGQRDEEPRGYLGASALGGSCSRELWYGFRWAAQPQFSSRILRLFERGHKEEAAFEELLIRARVQVYPVDPATNEQYVVKFKNRHVGGHADGVGVGLPDLPIDEWFLTEWKTHSEKSFTDLVKNGVQKSKPVHYAQVQLYMHRLRPQMQLNWALYGAVNKNNDDLYFELIPYDAVLAETLEQRADMIVGAATPPQRISDNPGWYQCKFCDFHSVCHKGRPMDVNCRSCVHVHPLVDGTWWCGWHDKIVDKQEQLAGCQDHVEIV